MIEGGQLLGILTFTDLVKHQPEVIDLLEKEVASGELLLLSLLKWLRKRMLYT